MAADHPGLNPLPHSDARGSALLALGLLLPMLAWTAVNLMAALDTAPDRADFILHMARGLLLAQTLVAALCLPWFAVLRTWQGTLCAPLLLVLVPLPMLVLLGHTVELASQRLLLPTFAVALCAAVLAAMLRLLATLIRQAPLRHLLLSASALVICAQAWAWRVDWMGWLAP